MDKNTTCSLVNKVGSEVRNQSGKFPSRSKEISDNLDRRISKLADSTSGEVQTTKGHHRKALPACPIVVNTADDCEE